MLIALSLCILSVTLVRAQPVETRVDSAQVVYAEGNALVLRLTNGDVRQFDVPDSVRFVVEGRDVAQRDLVPGMKFSATISTANAPRWVDGVEVVEVGTVWKISGGNLIVKSPAGENKMYRVPAGGTITLEGKTLAVDQLREGDRITATVLRTREAPAALAAARGAVKVAATPPKVGPLLIDEGVVQEEPSGFWGTSSMYILIAGGLALLAVVLLLFRRKRKV
jgi:LPXTG-motif cell wall-anchored protein